MNFDLPRLLIFVGLFLLLMGGTKACRANPDGPSLYTGARFGPGIDDSQRGTLHQPRTEDGEIWANLRVASTSLRLQDERSTPIGRIRASVGGWEFLTREGESRCSATNQESASVYVVQCDARTWALQLMDGGIKVIAPDAREDLIPNLDPEELIQASKQPWSTSAQTLARYTARRGYDPQTEDAYARLLLAWVTRDVHPTPGSLEPFPSLHIPDPIVEGLLSQEAAPSEAPAAPGVNEVVDEDAESTDAATESQK